MSKLQVVVRDLPWASCEPYSDSPATFYVYVLSCNWEWMDSFRCDRLGRGGGGIYGEIEVPEGTYLVSAFGWPPWVETNVDWVQVRCGETVGVNLVPIYWSQIVYRLQAAITAALLQENPLPGPQAAGLGRKDKRAVLERAQQTLTELQALLPTDPIARMVLPALQEADAPPDMIRVVEKVQGLSGSKG
ncbi:MAG: hypothetical protein K6T75_06965 [Acetobacteraceae bacterium]|nr:hypothetical protein [Acetobacteraceae bacterium]